jgi:hypothetical protein
MTNPTHKDLAEEARKLYDLIMAQGKIREDSFVKFGSKAFDDRAASYMYTAEPVKVKYITGQQDDKVYDGFVKERSGLVLLIVKGKMFTADYKIVVDTGAYEAGVSKTSIDGKPVNTKFYESLEGAYNSAWTLRHLMQ